MWSPNKRERRSQNPQDEVFEIKLERKTCTSIKRLQHELREFNRSLSLVIIVIIYLLCTYYVYYPYYYII
jgi:hypothetical protein